MTNGRMPLQDVQRCEVFLREAILFVRVHTAVVRARLATKECRTVLRRSVTCPHEVSPPPGGRRHQPRSILLPMVSDVESDDQTLAVCGRAFDDHDLGYLSVLAKVVVGA